MYMDELSVCLQKLPIGCCSGDIVVNHLVYRKSSIRSRDLYSRVFTDKKQVETSGRGANYNQVFYVKKIH